MNRRILYNRASADPQGRPWSERKKYMWWDEEAGKWAGYDVPDFPPGKRPDYDAPPDAQGMDAISGDGPFIMMPDGRAHLYSSSGLLDAPMPTHYEPLESPIRNELYPNVGANPVGHHVGAPGEPDRGARRRPLAAHRVHVPPHRGLHRGTDEPQPAVARGAPTRDVRRDRSDARRRARDRRR
jgi:formate dehydrogenase major subunit